MPYADCRKCRYFIPLEELSDGQKADVLALASHMGRDPRRVLGYCVKKNLPIVHYTGHCRDFEAKKTGSKQLTLFGGVAWVE